MKATC